MNTQNVAVTARPRRVLGRAFRRAAVAGYTAVEVMIAMTLFAVGAAGVFGMVKLNVQGNYDARTLDIANNIARAWEDRLSRDASFWTDPTAAAGTGSLSGTKWLKDVQAPPSAWLVPTTPAAGSEHSNSPAFDLLSRELNNAEGQNPETALFCTQVRLSWMVPQRAIRADVRVYWPRAGRPSLPCTQAGALSADLDNVNSGTDWRFVRTQTIVRGNFQ
jgi:prepilin-type N-terminal cleavage/methylation domain-containing protein